MKVALVHELLTMRGGAENVLKVFADMFPDAPIYTLLYKEELFRDWLPSARVRTSPLQGAPAFRILQATSYNLPAHHLYLSQFPAAIEAFPFDRAQGDKDAFDLVISSSSAFAHGIITNGKPRHLSYINSPARYVWDRTHDVLEQAGKGLFGPLKRGHLERTFHRLRIWDSEAADRADMLLAASKEVQRRIELYWRRDSDVVYPPLDDFWTQHEIPSPKSQVPSPSYLVVSTLARYKRIDLAIEAATIRRVPLIIAGEGPDRARLEKLAGPTVRFLGRQEKESLRELYANATATLFPGDEDFGLVPLESMACGTPVIAFGSGGALETVTEGTTGEFFHEPTPESLSLAIEKLEHHSYDPDACRKSAERFSKQGFEKSIRNAVDKIMR